uniref:C2H2-type domain-containing protein n=2 Tax=Gasterosteus aculeatus aculeatus TaxID=481459 RepID=A0AAQ4NVC8_GASAC
MWQCKDCGAEVSRRSEILKHYKLKHSHFGRGLHIKCVYPDWPALFHIDEIHAEFQRITAIPLESTFMAQLDSHVAQLTSIFQMKGGVAGQKLPKHLEILQEETSDVNLKRTAILKALCIYLGEDEGQLVREYIDIEGNDILRDLQKHTMGIYVINKEGGEMRHCDDIGIFVEGVIILDNCGSVARACAMMLGVIYALNMAYPKERKSSATLVNWSHCIAEEKSRRN